MAISWKDLGMDFETFIRTFYEFNEVGDLVLDRKKLVEYINEHKK